MIYVANGGPPAGQPTLTNETSFFFDYSDDLVQSMLEQSFTFATQGRPNSTAAKDPEWPACLACAVTDRARQRSGTSRSGVCVDCFERYCWSEDGIATTAGSKAKNGYARVGVSGVLGGVAVLLALLMMH